MSRQLFDVSSHRRGKIVSFRHAGYSRGAATKVSVYEIGLTFAIPGFQSPVGVLEAR